MQIDRSSVKKEGRMTGKPTRGRRRTQLLNDLVDKKDYVYVSVFYSWTNK